MARSRKQLAQFMGEVDRIQIPRYEALKVFARCRTREFSAVVKKAMVRVGGSTSSVEEAGLKSVTDPCGDGPFAVRRLSFEGEDRGFELRSAYDGPATWGAHLCREERHAFHDRRQEDGKRFPAPN